LERLYTPILSLNLMSLATPILVAAGSLMAAQYTAQQVAFWAGSDYWMHSPVRTLNSMFLDF